MNIEFIPAKNKTSGNLFGENKPWPTPRQYLLIVIHWIVGDLDPCIRYFQAPNNNKSSAHYVVGTDGRIVQMVKEENVAWHAGESFWKDYPTYYASTIRKINPVIKADAGKIEFKFNDWNSLNPCSIGIENAGPPSYIGLKSWSDKEISALVDLCKDIYSRHPEIKLIDHSRICSVKIDVIKGTGYKEDIFPWDEFVKATGIPEA